MQVTETTSEGLKRSYKIIIPASDIDQKIDGRLTEMSGRVNVPGFLGYNVGAGAQRKPK